MEKTLLIIKPDATDRHLTGEFLRRVESARFVILGLRMLHLDAVTARRFYAVHEGKPFVDALVDYMSSGPSVAVALERENAVKALREFVGATDPAKAACGTIRHDFGLDIQRNSVHASDGLDTARDELRFFFEKL